MDDFILMLGLDLLRKVNVGQKLALDTIAKRIKCRKKKLIERSRLVKVRCPKIKLQEFFRTLNFFS